MPTIAAARPNFPRSRALTLLSAVVLLACVWRGAAPAAAQDQPVEDPEAAEPQRLFEQEPYDQITLTAAHGSTVLKIKPLSGADRELSDPLPRYGKLIVRLLDNPATDYEVQWNSIQAVRLFEQLVLDEANELVAERELDEAYDFFLFLEEKHPQLGGLNESMQAYLLVEAATSYRAGRYDEALAMLRELHRRNPEHPKLERPLGATTDKLIDRYLERGDYRSARILLGNLADWFPRQEVVAKRGGQLREEAAGLVAAARQAADEGKLGEAVEASLRQQRIWPDLPGAKEVAESLHQQYPRVVVGVSALSADPQPAHWTDWAARRDGRLLYRTLTEFAGAGPDGGLYDCPVGTVEVDEFDPLLRITVAPDLRWSTGSETLTGYDVSRRLLAMGDSRDRAVYRPEFADALLRITVTDVYEAELTLHRKHLVPKALLQTKLIPHATATQAEGGDAQPWINGPYVAAARSDGEATFLGNEQYALSQPGQPRQVTERRFLKGSRAIEALKRGQIHVLDRVSPWGLDVVREDANLVVQRYDVPLVHCLVPNMTRPLMANRGFRRALAYGINRQPILDQLTRGAEAHRSVSQLVSGPFPRGIASQDTLSYAYDVTIEPRRYDPYLAVALAEVTLQQINESRKKQGLASHAKMPQLVLAHPPGEIARTACESIRRQLGLIGVPVELRELTTGMPRRVPRDVDLLYVELAVWEPVVDAHRLLGEHGIAGGCSAYMSQALRELAEANSWSQVHRQLPRIHRIAHDDVALVPLWQLADYFAYNKQLIQGIAPKTITLYQNIEQWRLVFRYPAEQ